MCPYCAENHNADACKLKGKMTSNCTSCARHMKKMDKSIDVQALFSTTRASLHHSPIDPTCPTMISFAVDKERQATAAKAQESAKAMDKSTSRNVHPTDQPIETTNAFRPLSEAPHDAGRASSTDADHGVATDAASKDKDMVSAQ